MYKYVWYPRRYAKPYQAVEPVHGLSHLGKDNSI